MKNISLREGKNLWDWFFMTGILDRLVLEALVKLVIVGVWYDMLEVRLGLKGRSPQWDAGKGRLTSLQH